MAIQTTGAVSLGDIQTEFGGSNPISIDEYYKGGANVADGITYTNFTAPLSGDYAANIPASGVVSLDDFRGSENPTFWDESTSPIVSGLSTSISVNFTLSDYISELQSGDTFAVCAMHRSGTSWTHSNSRQCTLAAVKGTSSSVTVPQYYDKQWVIQISYDGNDTVTIGGYYCCSSTNYSSGGVYLQGVTRR